VPLLEPRRPLKHLCFAKLTEMFSSDEICRRGDLNARVLNIVKVHVNGMLVGVWARAATFSVYTTQILLR